MLQDGPRDTTGDVEDGKYGPQTPWGEAINAAKHREPGESFRESCGRVASALQDTDAHYRSFREVLLSQGFLPGGRVMAAAGSLRALTAYNCFVSGTIEDNYTSGITDGTFFEQGGIMARAAQTAATLRMGGGMGLDFSSLRPRGDIIESLGSQSSGPVSFMGVFSEAGLATSSAGHRRGALMAVLRVDHPDILEFVRAKQNDTALRGFNVSAGVTDEFMAAVRDGTDYVQKFNGRPRRRVSARIVWEAIMRSTWDWAEPGVIFIDRVNAWNNLWYAEQIAATNPCGEQPLPPYGACLLGSWAIPKYLRRVASKWVLDEDLMQNDAPHIVRAMDNIVDRTAYALPEQKAEALNKRRMGLGVTGMANALEAMGHPYGSDSYVDAQRKVMSLLRDAAYRASVALAVEKGAFPLYKKEQYLDGRFIQTLPPDIRDAIASHGIRNSHLTSIAPTGTISLGADNMSGGIEPVFAIDGMRTVQTFAGPVEMDVQDYGFRFLGHRGKTADQVTIDEHVRVLCCAQECVDSAVSKTINVPSNTPWEQFKGAYMAAWQGGAKGCTTYQVGGKRAPVLKSKDDAAEEDPTCRIENGQRTCE